MTIKRGEIKIGDRIKELRLKNKLSYTDLSQSSGVSAIAIRKYESGERNPKSSTLEKIANGLNITYEDLVKGTDAVYVISFSTVKVPLPTHLHLDKYMDPSVVENNINLNTDIIVTSQINFDLNGPHNRAIQKLKTHETLTQEETQALSNYIQSGEFQRAFDSFSDSMKKLAELLRQNYELLNEEGQKKADKHIEYAADQIELLTKIPEYRKDNK